MWLIVHICVYFMVQIKITILFAIKLLTNAIPLRVAHPSKIRQLMCRVNHFHFLHTWHIDHNISRLIQIHWFWFIDHIYKIISTTKVKVTLCLHELPTANWLPETFRDGVGGSDQCCSVKHCSRYSWPPLLSHSWASFGRSTKHFRFCLDKRSKKWCCCRGLCW